MNFKHFLQIVNNFWKSEQLFTIWNIFEKIGKHDYFENLYFCEILKQISKS